MATQPLDPAAVAARETHRDSLGRFGVQPAVESACALSPSRDELHDQALAALSGFDPGRCGPGGVMEAVAAHRTMTAGASRTASETDRARGLAQCLRADVDGLGGLTSRQVDAVMGGTLPDAPHLARQLAQVHRGAAAHVADVRAGRSRVGDHPEDAGTVDDYRLQVGIRRPHPDDDEGTVEELALAWSFRLDRDAMDAVRDGRRQYS